jgi:hypothetical protein
MAESVEPLGPGRLLFVTFDGLSCPALATNLMHHVADFLQRQRLTKWGFSHYIRNRPWRYAFQVQGVAFRPNHEPI